MYLSFSHPLPSILDFLFASEEIYSISERYLVQIFHRAKGAEESGCEQYGQEIDEIGGSEMIRACEYAIFMDGSRLETLLRKCIDAYDGNRAG